MPRTFPCVAASSMRVVSGRERAGWSRFEFWARFGRDGRDCAARPQKNATAAPPPRRRHAQVRDVTISFHGANLIENTDFALNYGNRYGFIGPNGSGKSTIMKAIAARCLPIPESIDLFFLDQEYPATDTPALDAVFEV